MHHVISAEPGLDLPDPLHVHHVAAVDSHELSRVETLAALGDRASYQVTPRTGVELQVIAIRLDPIDVGRANELDLASSLHLKAIQLAHRARRTRCFAFRGEELLQQLPEPRIAMMAASGAEPADGA